jgi:hypothetical protein
MKNIFLIAIGFAMSASVAASTADGVTATAEFDVGVYDAALESNPSVLTANTANAVSCVSVAGVESVYVLTATAVAGPFIEIAVHEKWRQPENRRPSLTNRLSGSLADRTDTLNSRRARDGLTSLS